jgi:predicted nucleic-acid-binding Zn-ribbon protein
MSSYYISKIQLESEEQAKALGVYCPKCGGHSGFYHKAIYTHQQYIDFNGAPVSCDVEVQN